MTHFISKRALALGTVLLSLACEAPTHSRVESASATPTVPVQQSGTSGAVLPAAQVPAEESIGSLRNARVAFVTNGKPVPLTFLAGDVTPEELAAFSRLAPNVRILSGLSREQALAHAAEADACDARFITPVFLAEAKKLVWAQAMSAGVDRYLELEYLVSEDRIVLTNMQGVHGPAISDHVFAMLLSLTRDLRFHLANQATGTWGRDAAAERHPIVLQGRTMLVVGLGGIGGEVAQRAQGFGMHVIATRRSDTPSPAYLEYVGKPAELLTLLPRADVVVVCTPLTAETEHLFNRAAFAAMKPGAYFVNIARGRVVETEALFGALRDKRLAGACLDVTDPEPLPPQHPLWKMENVVITPHVASDGELTDQRAKQLFHENLRRFGAGLPLLNVVDKRVGY